MKYIVEFEDEPCMCEDEVHFYKCIQAPWWSLSERLIKQLTPYQPDHTADIGKKVSISCAHENDVIFRKVAIDALARMMPRSYTPDGSHPADEEIFRVQEVFADCIEALEILPSAQPDSCEGCKHLGQWENEVEYGYLSPCTCCRRRTVDNYER